MQLENKKIKNLLTKKHEMSYTENIEKEKTIGGAMKGTNAKTVEILERERERESLNLKDIGFISHSIKLYIKYKELKINLTEARNQMSDIRHPISDI